MNHSSFFKKSAVALAAVGLFASASAQADSLVLEQDINSLAFTVNVGGQQDDVVAGVFNVDNLTTGGSFLAFCFELLQGVGVGSLTPPGLEFTAASAVNANTQMLFNQSYATLDFTDASALAGFQIALWETLDDGNLTTGPTRTGLAIRAALKRTWPCWSLKPSWTTLLPGSPPPATTS